MSRSNSASATATSSQAGASNWFNRPQPWACAQIAVPTASSGAASAALLAPVGLLVGGVLIAGGLLYAWRRTRVKAQLFVEETELERQGLIARREALQRFIEEAHAMTAELRALNDRIAPLLKELSTVSHLYVQYWTYKQRQALTVLMEAMRELRERLDTHVQLHAI